MIEKIKTYKYGYKCIAMLLVFALSLNMLAGCGKSGSVNNTVQDEYKTENTAPEKDTEKESVDSQENTMPASELLGTELDTLEDKLAQLEFRRMFSGEYDSADCYLDIQAGSGGTEAQDCEIAEHVVSVFESFGD